MRLYDTRTGQEVLSLKVKEGFGMAFPPVFSSGGERLMVSTSSGGVRLFEAPLSTPRWQAERCNALARSLPSWHRSQAEAALRAENWFACAFHGSWGVKANPKDARCWVLLGWAKARQGDIKAAVQAYDQAVALPTHEPYIRRERAWFLAQTGRCAEALGDYRTLLFGPESANVHPIGWLEYGLLLVSGGQTDAYRAACREALQQSQQLRDPSRDSWVADLCNLGPNATADPQLVVRVAERACGKSPTPRQLNALEGALFRAGRHAEAVEKLQACIKASPAIDRGVPRIVLSMAMHKSGKTAEAQQTLTQAIQDGERRLKELSAYSGIPGLNWPWTLELEIFRREAEALILPARKGAHD
jgi:tetratricopeptide (TPR) repeat protein